jgi:hypothetical protein
MPDPAQLETVQSNGFRTCDVDQVVKLFSSKQEALRLNFPYYKAMGFTVTFSYVHIKYIKHIHPSLVLKARVISVYGSLQSCHLFCSQIWLLVKFLNNPLFLRVFSSLQGP